MYVDFISSPYLLVFGDDRVRGTREQRMLMQVVPVTLRYGAGDSMGDFYGLCYLYFEINCKSLWDRFGLFNFFVILDLELDIESIKV